MVNRGLWFSKRGLTLVELMVATSILSIGMVLIVRALLAASVALDSVENRIEAFQFLETQMADLQQRAHEEGGLQPGNHTGTTALNNRLATWVLEIVPIELEAPSAEADASSEKPPAEKPPVKFTEARFRLSWPEGQRTPDAVLVTYFHYRPLDDEEGSPG
jgi:prepilin-type N-terminal cleavage/methylation domain-containing protein